MGVNEELKDSLETLRSELASGQPLSVEQREKLEAVLGDVSQLFEGEDEHSHESLAERISDAAEHFEDTHPELTLALGAVASVLSRMGI